MLIVLFINCLADHGNGSPNDDYEESDEDDYDHDDDEDEHIMDRKQHYYSSVTAYPPVYCTLNCLLNQFDLFRFFLLFLL